MLMLKVVMKRLGSNIIREEKYDKSKQGKSKSENENENKTKLI